MATESERAIAGGIGLCAGLLVGIVGILLAPHWGKEKWRGFVWPDAKDPMISFTVGEYENESECAAANERAIQATKLSGIADSVCKRNCKPLAFSASRQVCEGDLTQ
ncbi:hypothetical protein [Pseudomonas sp. CGJS7]|uniref:hypothetical protein n=1 Tax=Pseudomonas sp. CGJS7 TaxID=3109348 RepID=UPI00300BCF8B